jgi:hypothetical protein
MKIFLILLLLLAFSCNGTKDSQNSKTQNHSDSVKKDRPQKSVTKSPVSKKASVAPVVAEYDFKTHGSACKGVPAATSVKPVVMCKKDSECGVCHDGSRCGTVMRRDEIMKLGKTCEKGDSAKCELFGVHCCGGKCLVTSQSGNCKKGIYWVKGKCY